MKSRWFVLTFLSVIIVGCGLLMLPSSSALNQPTPFIDALFASVSAVSDTGEVIFKTHTYWSLQGQLIILALVQLGGLGLMTSIIFIFLYVGKHFNHKDNAHLKKVLSPKEELNFYSLGKNVLVYGVTIEFFGALLLMIDFIPRYGVSQGIYYAIFHSVTAFCNAGFDLFNNSLEGFRDNPYVLIVFSILMILGSLGFLIIKDLFHYRKTHKLMYHTKVVLISTGGLMVISAVLFMISESVHGTFSDLPLFERIINYLFMSITPRTAGFANVDYLNVSKFGLILTMFLMYVGGASGSTAGGVKVTTLSVLGLDFIHRNGQSKRVDKEEVKKSLFIVIGSIAVIVIASMILMQTESIPDSIGIDYIIMDVFSCFSSVGLTLGLPNTISQVGKVVLIVIMFIGRVGLLTLFWSITNPAHEPSDKVKSVMVG